MRFHLERQAASQRRLARFDAAKVLLLALHGYTTRMPTASEVLTSGNGTQTFRWELCNTCCFLPTLASTQFSL